MMPHEQAVYEIFVGALTDVGRARKHNEDYIGYHIPEQEKVRKVYGSLFVVCDGVGGSAAGEVASKHAVYKIMQAYYALPAEISPLERLVKAIHAANVEIYQMNLKRTDGREMATTVVAAVLVGTKMFVAHVGDSRAYLVRDGQIVQLTEDHSWVAEMVRSGDLTPEEAERHPWKNRITRSLGASKSVSVDAQTVDVLPGDRVVLCSDGLTRHVSDAEINEQVSLYPAEQAVRRLVDLANKRGGKDNISVITVELLPEEEAAERARRKSLSAETTQVIDSPHPTPVSFLQKYMLLTSVVILFLIGIGAGLVYMLTRGGNGTAEVPPTPTARQTASVSSSSSQGAVGGAEQGMHTPSASVVQPNVVVTPPPTATPTATPSPTGTPTVTPTFTWTPTATPTATATPTPTPAPVGWAQVPFTKELYLRQGPSTQDDIIATLAPGTRLELLGNPVPGERGKCKRGLWRYVRVAEGKHQGKEGYVCNEDLTNFGSQPPSAVATWPAPEAVSPNGGTFVESVTFKWRWAGPPLGEHQAFDVRVWRKGEDTATAKGIRDVREIGHRRELTLELPGPLPGPGDYMWTVVVVAYTEAYPEAGSVKDLSPTAEPLSFTYAPPTPTPLPPTDTPTPLPTPTPTPRPTDTPTPLPPLTPAAPPPTAPPTQTP